MKRTLTLSIGLIGVLFFTACKRHDSISVDQNRIYSEYEYKYSAETNKSTASAVFRMDHSNGNKIQLSYPSLIKFSGQNMPYRSLMGSYQVEVFGTNSGGQFEYSNNEGQSFINEARILSPVDIPFGLTTISQNGNFFLPWTGGALEPGEMITVRISGASGSRSFSTSQVGSTHVILDANGLQAIGPGNATLQISRTRTEAISQATIAGGLLSSTYEGRKYNIAITM